MSNPTTTSLLPGYAHHAHYKITSPAPYVAHVEINRPAKLNAFVRDMWLELRAVFRQLSADPEVRAVVLSGAGERAFTAGLDVHAASQGEAVLQGAGSSSGGVDGARVATAMRREVYEFQECISAVEKCEKRECLLDLASHDHLRCPPPLYTRAPYICR